MRHFKETLLLGAAATLLVGCNRGTGGAAAAGTAPQAAAVKVQAASLQKVPQFTEYIAVLKSRNAAVLQPEVEGQVTQILVRAGDRVKAGAPLLVIDPRKQEATVNSQEGMQRARLAALEYNRQELERRKRLFEAGVVSRQELDQAQAAYDASQAEVDALQASVREQQVQLRYFTVKAPTSGVVGDIPVRVGDRVQSSTMLTTVDEGGELEAYVSVPAEKAAGVRVGTALDIVSEDGQATSRTKVTFVSPRVDPETQLLLIKARVPNPEGRFRNDQVVRARVIWQESELPIVPITAVARMAGQSFVFVAESDGKQTVARQRPVQLGELSNQGYVVTEGIKAGDKVIVTGVQMLADGMPVALEQ
jgi:RND family efflux transporter MFP subunit